MSDAIDSQTVGLPSQPVTDDIFTALAELLRTGTDSGILESQRIMLRRLALQGDVARSRIPAPLNITEIGGYLNLVRDLNEQMLQSQMLAGALGVAGPDVTGTVAVPDGEPSDRAFAIVVNLRPSLGTAMVPNSILVRQDLLFGFERLRSDVTRKGATLPLTTSRRLPLPLEFKPTPLVPYRFEATSVFPAVGRRMSVAGGLLCSDPTADVLLVGRRSADPTESFRLLAFSTDPTIAAEDWDACKMDVTTGQIIIQQVNRSLISLPEVFHAYGWTSMLAPTVPLSLEAAKTCGILQSDEHLVSCTKTAIGVTGAEAATTLREELANVYPARELDSWQYEGLLSWVWCQELGAFINPREEP